MKSLLTGIFLVFICCINNSSPDKKMVNNNPVKNFELARYLGTWYEIARFPHSFEKDLCGVTATYSLRNDGKIRVVNSGYKDSLNGKFKTIEGKAKTTDNAGNGHLKVSFFLFFYADYYILELDTTNYEYALVGSSSPKYLWILCRNPEMPEETYLKLVDLAKERGYAIQNLIRVEQKLPGSPDKK